MDTGLALRTEVGLILNSKQKVRIFHLVEDQWTGLRRGDDLGLGGVNSEDGAPQTPTRHIDG